MQKYFFVFLTITNPTVWMESWRSQSSMIFWQIQSIQQTDSTRWSDFAVTHRWWSSVTTINISSFCFVFLGGLSCLFMAWGWPWVFCFLSITFASSYQHLHVARYHIKVTLLNQLSDNLQTWSIKRKRGQMPIRRDSPCDFYIVILMFDWISSRRNCKYLCWHILKIDVMKHPSE